MVPTIFKLKWHKNAHTKQHDSHEIWIIKIADLTAESVEYDVITLTETWLHKHIKSEEMSLEGFNEPYRIDRKLDPHRGVAIYIRTHINSKDRKDLEIEKLEATWCERRETKYLKTLISFDTKIHQ